MRRFASLLLAATLAACGSSSADSPAPDVDAGNGTPIDAGSSDDGPAYDAPAEAAPAPDAADAGDGGLGYAPPAVAKGLGAVMASPRFVAVTFDADPERAGIDALTKGIGASAYWKSVASEYGVGAATGDVIHLSEAAPATVDPSAGDSEAWLATRFDGTHREWGTFDPNAVYVLFYPPATQAKGSPDCGPAYHSYQPVTLGPADAGTSATMIYAVVFKCADGHIAEYPTGFDMTTLSASHEMFEAATDPDGAEFAQVDPDHAAWCYFIASELGDMCSLSPGSTIKPVDFPFAVQRMWSNAAMAAGRDPCVPGTPGPVLFAVPQGAGRVRMKTSFGQIVDTKGFKVPAGTSTVIDVELAGASSDEWTITPVTLAMEGGYADPYLQLSLDKTTGHAGDVVHLTVERLQNDPTDDGDAVKLVTSNGDAAVSWFVAIGE